MLDLVIRFFSVSKISIQSLPGESTLRFGILRMPPFCEMVTTSGNPTTGRDGCNSNVLPSASVGLPHLSSALIARTKESSTNLSVGRIAT